MKVKTDRYNAALREGAKPLVNVYVGTDQAIRCYGKETPHEAHLDASFSVYAWEARILSAGTANQRLSADGENVFLNLRQESMTTYAVSLDNTDYEISKIAGRELFAGGPVIVQQGFDVPGFTAVDFITLFTGIIEDIDTSHPSAVIRALSVAKSVDPATPVIDTTTTYQRKTSGTLIGSATGDYPITQEIFLESATWKAEIEGDTPVWGKDLLYLQNVGTSQNRFLIGVDATGHPFLKVIPDISAGTPVTSTYTADFVLGAGAYRLTVDVNQPSGILTIYDATGNRYTFSVEWVFSAAFGSTELTAPYGLAYDAADNIYITDLASQVVKYTKTGVFVQTYTAVGTMNAPLAIDIASDNKLWMTNQQFGQEILIMTNAGAVFGTLTIAGESGKTFLSLALDSLDNVWVGINNGIAPVYKLTPAGATILTLPGGSADNQVGRANGLDTDNFDNIWVLDGTSRSIKQFDNVGTWIQTFSGPGTEPDQLQIPNDIYVDAGYVYVSDEGSDTIKVFRPSGVFVGEIGSPGSGDGHFLRPRGIAASTIDTLAVADTNRGDGQLFTSTPLVDFDRGDTSPTSNNTIVVDDGGANGVTTLSFTSGLLDPTWLLTNTNATNTVFPDLINGNNLPVSAGTWEAAFTSDNITSEDQTLDAISVLTTVYLPTAGRYSNPGKNQANLLLPFPYGTVTENADAAVWVCPLINSLTFDYCVAGWPVQPVNQGNTVSVFVDGVAQTSGWTFFPAFDYESQGLIAYLHFDSAQTGTVSVVCNGKWVNSALLTNPIDILEDWIAYAALLLGVSGWVLNSSSFNAARAFSTENNYVGAGVILANQTLAHWIKQILASFLGSFQFNDLGEIAISLLPLEVTPNIQGELVQNERITLHAKQQANNILGSISTDYAVSYVLYDKRYINNALMSFDRTQEDSSPVRISNSAALELQFEWNRNTASIVLMHTALLERYGGRQWTLTYQGQDFLFVALDVIDQLTATLDLVRGPEGEPIEDVLYEIRAISINLDTFDSSLTLESLAVPIPQPVFLQRIPVFLEQEQVFLGSEYEQS